MSNQYSLIMISSSDDDLAEAFAKHTAGKFFRELNPVVIGSSDDLSSIRPNNDVPIVTNFYKCNMARTILEHFSEVEGSPMLNGLAKTKFLQDNLGKPMIITSETNGNDTGGELYEIPKGVPMRFMYNTDVYIKLIKTPSRVNEPVKFSAVYVRNKYGPSLLREDYMFDGNTIMEIAE